MKCLISWCSLFLTLSLRSFYCTMNIFRSWLVSISEIPYLIMLVCGGIFFYMGSSLLGFSPFSMAALISDSACFFLSRRNLLLVMEDTMLFSMTHDRSLISRSFISLTTLQWEVTPYLRSLIIFCMSSRFGAPIKPDDEDEIKLEAFLLNFSNDGECSSPLPPQLDLFESGETQGMGFLVEAVAKPVGE